MLMEDLTEREVRWTVNEEFVKVEYIYREKATGEVVVHGADILSFRGVTGETTVGVLNG
jgi:hypothetical protein